VIKLREAARAAGRPQIGIHNLISNAERTDATLAAIQADFGAQPNDGLCIAATAELKIDYERVKKVVALRHSGHNKYALYGPLMGGYAGGPEATAIVLVAYHFLGVLALEAQWHCCFPLHIHHLCNTTRELLWIMQHRPAGAEPQHPSPGYDQHLRCGWAVHRDGSLRDRSQRPGSHGVGSGSGSGRSGPQSASRAGQRHGGAHRGPRRVTWQPGRG